MATLFDGGNGLYATPREPEFIDREFPNAASISIDYAIMEKADRPPRATRRVT